MSWTMFFQVIILVFWVSICASVVITNRKEHMMTVKFEPRDVWIGWFWDRRDDGTHHYVCLVPMLVIHWVRRARR